MRRDRRDRDPRGKHVLLVEEEDHRRLREPARIADAVKEHERFLHLIRIPVLVQILLRCGRKNGVEVRNEKVSMNPSRCCSAIGGQRTS